MKRRLPWAARAAIAVAVSAAVVELVDWSARFLFMVPLLRPAILALASAWAFALLAWGHGHPTMRFVGLLGTGALIAAILTGNLPGQVLAVLVLIAAAAELVRRPIRQRASVPLLSGLGRLAFACGPVVAVYWAGTGTVAGSA
jgi:hypothetical protein